MTYAKEGFTFRGRYCDMIKSLSTPCDNRQVFSTYYQGYVFCALYGVLNGCHASLSTNSGEVEATIKADVMNHGTGLENYDFLRKLVILHENKRKLTFSQRLDYALRFDNSVDESTPDILRESSKFDENTNLLNEYVLGGLSEFYDKISKFKKTEDVLSFMNDVIANFIATTTSEGGTDSLDLEYNN